VFAIKYAMIRTLLLQGYDVLVDDTHTTDESILRLLEIDVNATYFYVDTSINVCKDRAVDTKQEDLIPIIDRHWANIYNHGLTLDSRIKNLRLKVERRNENRNRV